jgi:hypothetical protein
MNDQPAIAAFVEDLHQDVRARAESDGDGIADEAAFTEMVIELLQEFGEIDEATVCHFEKRGVKVSGYGVSEDHTTLDLLASECDWTLPPTSFTQTRLNQTVRKLKSFFEQAASGFHERLEESGPAYDMSSHIHQIHRSITRVRLFVLTDSIAKKPEVHDGEHDGVYFTHHIWDAERLFRCETSGKKREPIFVDFSEFGEPIPVLTYQEGATYTSYLAIIPGTVLAQLYERWGARLLERNVRTFLQARGKVNRGIRETILNEPDMFFTYNNGISATAERAHVIRLGTHLDAIEKIEDLQIVNGGQTTASLFNTFWKDKADLNHVRVPMKLTVVEVPERLDEIVSNISRFSNTQNNVSTADFASNDPFHRHVEELSRTVWAPDPGGGKNQTRWYYERARGQYNDEKARQGTQARIRAWTQLHPNKQRFTKTDLAKYENCWEQLPYLVCRGAQKNFAEFSIALKERRSPKVDEEYFEDLVAKAILFRRADSTIRQLGLGGYKAQIVAYTISWISNLTAQRLDLQSIWTEQDISGALTSEIEGTAKVVYEQITSPPGGQNISEWCKKEACWRALLERSKALSSALETQLLHRDSKPRGRSRESAAREVENNAAVQEAAAISPDVWFEIANWARVTGNMKPHQRSMCFNTGRKISRGGDLSRLAPLALKAYEEALGKGFKPGIKK